MLEERLISEPEECMCWSAIESLWIIFMFCGGLLWFSIWGTAYYWPPGDSLIFIFLERLFWYCWSVTLAGLRVASAVWKCWYWWTTSSWSLTNPSLIPTRLFVLVTFLVNFSTETSVELNCGPWTPGIIYYYCCCAMGKFGRSCCWNWFIACFWSVWKVWLVCCMWTGLNWFCVYWCKFY